MHAVLGKASTLGQTQLATETYMRFNCHAIIHQHTASPASPPTAALPLAVPRRLLLDLARLRYELLTRLRPPSFRPISRGLLTRA
jgi:hypothetical protein